MISSSTNSYKNPYKGAGDGLRLPRPGPAARRSRARCKTGPRESSVAASRCRHVQGGQLGGAWAFFLYIITYGYVNSASHQLDTLSPAHPCTRLHGHNYVVELVLQAATVNEHGFVVDYLDLKAFKNYLDEELDHRHLNDILPFPTSAENLARHLYQWARERWPEVTGQRDAQDVGRVP
jgi:6-pyruvoyltetrahydropterin/6-carboxytetrahydropterin synthase